MHSKTPLRSLYSLECFISFVQSAVNARTEGHENPHSTVLAETMKLLANTSYNYQIMDRSGHPLTKYMKDEKAHKAMFDEFFKRLHNLNNNVGKVESVKSKVEQKEPTVVGFFNLAVCQTAHTLLLLQLFS